MRGLFRSAYILAVVWRFGLHEWVLNGTRRPWARVLGRLISLGRTHPQPSGERLRLALESLGPIFVKFGQVLSTRRDLLPTDVADELARLQDRVPAFDSQLAVDTIEAAFDRPIDV